MLKLGKQKAESGLKSSKLNLSLGSIKWLKQRSFHWCIESLWWWDGGW